MTTESDGAPATGREPVDVAWRSLHPGSLAVNLVPRAWSLVRAMWPILLAWVYGQTQADGGARLFDAALLLAFFGLAAWSTVVHWATLRYRVAEGRLEVQTGVLNRQVRVIAPERIQNLEMVRNVFHRLTGLVEVRIETASGTEVEGLLSALSVDQATALIEALGRTGSTGATEALEPIVENGTLDLVRFGATAGRLGAIAVLIGLASEWIQISDPTQVERVGVVLGTLGAIALVLAAVSGAFVLGVGTAIVRHHGFRLLRRPGALIATEGLFTTRQVELPIGKVQLVTVAEPVLRRLLGFGSVHLETAAAREGQGGIQHAEAMAPYVEHERFATVIRAAVPDLDVDLDTLQAQLRPPHPRALTRALIVACMRGALITAAAVWWFGAWGGLFALSVPIGLLTAWLDHRAQGWLVSDKVVIARRGWWNRVTQVVDRGKLQSLSVSQGPLLHNYGLAALAVRVAGSSVVLPLLSWDDARDVQELLIRPPPAAS